MTTITYTNSSLFPNIKFPVLHKIIIASSKNDSPIVREEKFEKMRTWLMKNCKSNYYIIPSWQFVYGVQFECEEEAIMFGMALAGEL